MRQATNHGQFALVHFITADTDDRLYVCDRENHRIQIFSTQGEVLAEWTGFVMPSDLAFGRDVIYVKAGADGVSIWTKDRRKLSVNLGRDEPFEEARSTCTASGSTRTKTSIWPSSIARSAS